MIEYKLTADQYDKIWKMAVLPTRTMPTYDCMKTFIKDEYNGIFVDELFKVTIIFNCEKDLTMFLLKV